MIISPHGSTRIPRILPLLTSCSEANNKNPCQSVSIRVQKNIYPCAKKNIYPCDYIPTRIPRVLPYLSVVAKLTIKSVQSVGYNLQKPHLSINVCRINTDNSSNLCRWQVFKFMTNKGNCSRNDKTRNTLLPLRYSFLSNKGNCSAPVKGRRGRGRTELSVTSKYKHTIFS